MPVLHYVCVCQYILQPVEGSFFYLPIIESPLSIRLMVSTFPIQLMISYIWGPRDAPTITSRNAFIIVPVLYPFSLIHAFTTASVEVAEKSSVLSSNSLNSLSKTGESLFHLFLITSLS